MSSMLSLIHRADIEANIDDPDSDTVSNCAPANVSWKVGHGDKTTSGTIHTLVGARSAWCRVAVQGSTQRGAGAIVYTLIGTRVEGARATAAGELV